MTSPIFVMPDPAPLKMYVIGSIALPALPANDSVLATAPALPAPETAPPAPPVNTVVRTLKVTAPAALDGFEPHWSQASRALPVSFIAVRDSRSQDGSLSSGAARNSAPAPGTAMIARPVPSLARPVQDCLKTSQPWRPTRPPSPLRVPHTPSTTMPLPNSQACSQNCHAGMDSSTASPHGRDLDCFNASAS